MSTALEVDGISGGGNDMALVDVEPSLGDNTGSLADGISSLVRAVVHEEELGDEISSVMKVV
jgi:hypothetical protein